MNTPSKDIFVNRIPGLPERKRPAHGVYISDSKPTIVFITVCTKDRQPWLADEEYHGILLELWGDSSAWIVGRYVIMPDHIHLFASPSDQEYSLERWIQYWKSFFSRRKRNPAHKWQSGHWDRRLRSGESYDNKWEYVRNNPVRHGLVEKSEDWPFQGEVYVLSWF